MTQAAQLFSVTGIVAVITGGGSGIGLMVAKALDANGAAAVYIVGRRREVLEAAAEQGVNGKIIPIVGDVTSKESLSAIAEKVKQEQGYINVLFANSGILGRRMKELLPELAQGRKPTVGELVEGLWSVPMEDFTQTQHVNITGVFYTVLAFLELLDAGNAAHNVVQKSQIVVITSIAGFSRMPNSNFAYSVSKAAANHMVKMLQTYFVDYDIRVNGVAPGIYPSEMTVALLPKEDGKKPWEEGGMPREMVPLRRTGSEDDMVGLVLFLTSVAGAFINGNIMITDGGRVGQLPSSY